MIFFANMIQMSKNDITKEDQYPTTLVQTLFKLPASEGIDKNYKAKETSTINLHV